MEDRLIRVGITHGDINGVGYEVILKTFSDVRVSELCTPIIYGSSKIAAYHRKLLEMPSINVNVISKAGEAGLNRVNIINCVDDDTKVEISKSTAVAGEAAFKALDAAVTDLKRGVVDVLLTAPINKHNIQNETFHFPGHTEYLEQCFAGKNGRKALMILMSRNLRVALVTGHLPLSKVAEAITPEAILSKLLIFNRALKQDFALEKQVGPVGDAERLLHVVVCNENANVFILQPPYDVLNIFHSNRVDTGKRLVEHDEFGVNGQASGNLRTATFTS